MSPSIESNGGLLGRPGWGIWLLLIEVLIATYKQLSIVNIAMVICSGSEKSQTAVFSTAEHLCQVFHDKITMLITIHYTIQPRSCILMRWLTCFANPRRPRDKQQQPKEQSPPIHNLRAGHGRAGRLEFTPLLAALCLAGNLLDLQPDWNLWLLSRFFITVARSCNSTLT